MTGGKAEMRDQRSARSTRENIKGGKDKESEQARERRSAGWRMKGRLSEVVGKERKTSEKRWTGGLREATRA